MSFISGTNSTGGTAETISKNVPNCITLPALKGGFWRCTGSSGATTGSVIIPSPTAPDGTTSIPNQVAERCGYYLPSPAQFDLWRVYAFVPAGTYTVRIDCVYFTDRGIATLYIDDVAVGTPFDMYLNVSEYTRYKTVTGRVPISNIISNYVIGTSGIKKIELRMDSKHGSSIAYYISFRGLYFIRTA